MDKQNNRRAVAIPTARLVLREFCEDDLDAVHSYASDPEVSKYMPWGPNSIDQTREFLARATVAQSAEPRRTFELAVTLKGTGELIGGCGLRWSDPANRSGDIGYCLRRDVWGRGYATELAAALINFGFRELGLRRIWATCDVANAASARVLEKCSMKQEGVLRENAFQHGEWRDSMLWAVVCPFRIIPVDEYTGAEVTVGSHIGEVLWTLSPCPREALEDISTVSAALRDSGNSDVADWMTNWPYRFRQGLKNGFALIYGECGYSACGRDNEKLDSDPPVEHVEYCIHHYDGLQGTVYAAGVESCIIDGERVVEHQTLDVVRLKTSGKPLAEESIWRLAAIAKQLYESEGSLSRINEYVEESS